MWLTLSLLLFGEIHPVCLDELLFLHGVWRPGEVMEENVCRCHTFTEEDGSESIPIGKLQHFQLGRLIHGEYKKFISQRCESKQFHFHTANESNAVISTACNLHGMHFNDTISAFANDAAEFEKDGPCYSSFSFPSPATNHITNPNTFCPRLEWLRKRQKEILKVDGFKKNTRVKNEKSDFMPSAKSSAVSKKWKYESSLRSSVSTNFEAEIGKIQGGSLLWDIICRIEKKVHCLEKRSANDSECEQIGLLKYYAYSAENSALDVLLALLSLRIVEKPGHRAHPSALLIETWKATSGICLKFLQNNDWGSSLQKVTNRVGGCEGESCCAFEKFKKAMKPYTPPRNMTELCLDTKSNETSFEPNCDQKCNSQVGAEEAAKDDGVRSLLQESIVSTGQLFLRQNSKNVVRNVKSSPENKTRSAYTSLSDLPSLYAPLDIKITAHEKLDLSRISPEDFNFPEEEEFDDDVVPTSQSSSVIPPEKIFSAIKDLPMGSSVSARRLLIIVFYLVFVTIQLTC